jgi:solute carrier family 13 (sodium-dependent dicarboxylate transporter), member 2/3/5
MHVMIRRLTPALGSFASPLPDSVRRPLATVALLTISVGLAWAAVAAGWPREQAIVVAILTATVLLWVTEALPLFATAFISIAMQLLLLGNPGGWRWLGFESGGGPTPEAFLAAAADPVLLLFFGGLVLARAATRTGVDHRVAALVLRPMADTPERLLLGVILATAGFSLWMSNTATAALMLTLVAPVVAQVPSGHPFRKAMLLAIPVAANVAGMSTPIASPPNAIAISYLSREDVAVGFLEWMMIACPIVVLLLWVTWRRLLRLYPPPRVHWHIEFGDQPLRPAGNWVVVVALLTFTLWVTEPLHGVRAALVAVVPAVLLLASRVIDRDDVNSLDWDVLILIAGGLTLGYSLQVTALDERIAMLVPDGGGAIPRLAVLAAATITLGTFFSNTAIASMLMPVAIIAAAGAGDIGLAGYALGISLAASLSMALPVSTPPNAMAYATGELTTRDFLGTAAFVGGVGTVLVLLALGIVRPWILGLLGP